MFEWGNTAGKILYASFVITILIMPFIIAKVTGFCDIGSMCSKDKQELARVVTSIAFPMTAIMTFILTQIINLREKDADPYHSLMALLGANSHIGLISTIAVIECAIAGLLSFQHFKSGGDMWLVIALYLLFSMFTLLVVNTISFYIYLRRRES
ncbi:MAG: hypothetical protein LBC03_04885 [Nitrososphaerota archaeon]|jgi:hypothetical protein|nr:hypothetical protein [Nitrososphaerota archaeon]